MSKQELKIKSLENKTPDELLEMFGSTVFIIATELKKTTNVCFGNVGMTMLDVFVEASKQAEDRYFEEKENKHGDN